MRTGSRPSAGIVYETLTLPRVLTLLQPPFSGISCYSTGTSCPYTPPVALLNVPHATLQVPRVLQKASWGVTVHTEQQGYNTTQQLTND